MKTTIEIPDPLFRRAKSTAAAHGRSLKAFITEAIKEKLAARETSAAQSEPEWMRGFGKLRRLHAETARIQRAIDDAFEVIEPEDRL